MAPYRSLSQPPYADNAAAAEASRQRLSRLAAQLWTAVHPQKLRAERTRGWHTLVFQDLPHAGCIRPRDSIPAYQIVNSDRDLVTKHGKPGTKRSVEWAQRKAFKRCSRRAARLSARGQKDVDDERWLAMRVAVAARLFVDLHRIQPFRYGNEAVAYMALLVAYRHLGIDSDPFDPASLDESLDHALNGRRNRGLQMLVEDLMAYIPKD